MEMPEQRQRFVEKYLDPTSRLGEILFGLIMALSFTLTAGLVVKEGPDAVRELGIAIVGCNLAWGFIDGAMYVMNAVYARGRRARIAEALRSGDEAAGLNVVRREIHETFEELCTPAEQERLAGAIRQYVASGQSFRAGITREDLMGGVASFWLVFASCLPAVIPFLIFSEAHLALRVSNLLLVVLLFLTGWKWAKYAHLSRWGTGIVMVLIGLGLVGVAILLGG
jgi:hypothetical protein